MNRYASAISVAQVVFLVAQFCDIFVANVLLFSGSGVVNRKSAEAVKVMQMRVGPKGKIERKVIASLTTVKVWFASNFVDSCTPLIIQSFCASQTMNLLLLI